MRKLVFILGLHLALASAWAQTETSRVTVRVSESGARFIVDGVEYNRSVSFFWAEGSQHVLQFVASKDGFQYIGADGRSIVRYEFGGWSDPSGSQSFGTGFTQTVIVTPELTAINLEVQLQYLVKLIFWAAEPAPGEPSPSACTDANLGGPGVVYVGETCYWRNTEMWTVPTTLELRAYPYPGHGFQRWTSSMGSSTNPLLVLNVAGATNVYAYFRTASRVKFMTEPLGMNVAIDGTITSTPTQDPCPSRDLLPPGPAPGSGRLCRGEIDWVPGTTHRIGAPTPQTDGQGRWWVFTKFASGQENNAIYEVTSTARSTLVAQFARGARVSFVTKPSGLKLLINGTSNHLTYNFIAPEGDVFTVSAPQEQVDADGRKWVFRSWSNEGEREQEVTVPEGAVESGYRLTATYEVLSQVTIETTPANGSVMVDGAPCDTPCTIDRPDGTEVSVVAPEQHVINHAARLEFESWADGGPRERTIPVSGSATANYVAHYTRMYLLDASSSPPDGATFVMEPPSPDGFFLEGTPVTITAEAAEGYRFRRWETDLQGTFHVGSLTMLTPRTVVAMMDEADSAPSATLMSAVGQTPEGIVAPNSMISIYGTDLALHPHTGSRNPLEQLLLDTTVRIEDRILALLFVSPEQINAVMHPDIPEGVYTAIVSRPGKLDIEATVVVSRNAPGLFTSYRNDQFYIVANHEDGTSVTPESPARAGELISVLGTGFGEYNATAPYGFPLPESPEFLLVDTVEAFAGEMAIEPEFAGGAPGWSGMDLLKIRISEEMPAASTVEFKIRINGHESNTVLLPLE